MYYHNFTEAYSATLYELVFDADYKEAGMHEIIGGHTIGFPMDELANSTHVLQGSVAKERAVNYEFAKSFADSIIRGDSDFSRITGLSERAKAFANAPLPENLPANFSIAYGERILKQKDSFVKQLMIPGSRRAIMSIWCPDDYLLLEEGFKGEFACTSSIQGFVRNNALHLHVHMRSSNAYRILPIDVYNFCRFMQHIGELIGKRLGNYTMSFGSLHLFESDLDKARLLANVN